MTTYGEVIDSRDLLKELRDLLEDSSYDYSDDPTGETWAEAWAELDDEDRERVQMLRDLLDELPESTVDSPHGNSWGSTLVREDYFTEYARQLADDIGAIDTNTDWPLNHIDWPAAAQALKADYTTVELDGFTYYAR
jgi:hypothetical protein